jgi:hypothetical protein
MIDQISPGCSAGIDHAPHLEKHYRAFYSYGKRTINTALTRNVQFFKAVVDIPAGYAIKVKHCAWLVIERPIARI